MRRLLAAVAGLLPVPVLAATLFGVVTERAAPLAAEAAARHVAMHPGDRIVLRTPAQLLAMPAQQLTRSLAEADAVLAVAVFGDPARRLKEALPRARAAARIVAMNGEATLSLRSRPLPDAPLDGFPGETLRQLSQETPPAEALAAAEAHPGARAWLALRRTWQAGGSDNVATLYRHLLHPGVPLPAPQPEPALRLRVEGVERSDAAAWRWHPLPAGPALVVLDLANADPAPADALCATARRKGMSCAAVLARWAATSREVVERLPELMAPARPAALVVLQDFVVGAAEHREAVSAALARLDVPVIKAIRLTDRTAMQWRLSPDGLPPDSVQYRVALPELQGSSQPIVVATSGKPGVDRLTGIEIRRPEVVSAEVERLVSRAARWQALATKRNFDKRVALIYYNHPPGRQNIGADNLDVPQSLFHLLREMQAAGYDTGELPASPEALLEMIMDRGVNLPEDRAELARMAPNVHGVSAADYARWFATLPPRVRGEMVDGPLGRLHAEVLEAERAGEGKLGAKRVEAALKDLHHLVEGADHPRRDAAIQLLAKLEAGYRKCLAERAKVPCAGNAATARRLTALGIEGLRGWGPTPGQVMVHGNGAYKHADARLLVPGLVFGKVFVGPQPPRGWEVDEELLHANTSITPPHQFLAFYHWLRDAFRADAVVHLGRHSTYEFLPGKAAGLTADDYPSLIASDLPGIYPYIVDGVGEGVQAKRRGLAVIVDHLTPPLAATPLYDQLLALRQVVESFEASSSEAIKATAARTLREQVVALNLRQELEASMADVLAVRGISFDAADDELLAHEIGHYLTKLQEKFMPHGLHIFGKDWSRDSLELMLDSMRRGGIDDPAVAEKLAASPKAEITALLAGLEGRYIAPGKGNDPLRSPEALPTGRNFHAVDGDLLPTRLGYQLGQDFAARAMKKKAAHEGSEAVILWASDAVRDEGVMVGFSLALMGAEPVWNARGIVTDVRLVPDASRRDVIVTTSGLFRDLYPNLLRLIDRAGLLALAASANRIARDRPELQEALAGALQPLGNVEWGDETPATNRVGGEWLRRVDVLRQRGLPLAVAGREAALRLFGDAPGAYGAGINRLTERSGAWTDRLELARVYRTRLGHAYGLASEGEGAHAAFDAALTNVGRAWHGRASNLYGVLDNNDAFDYLGGLSLAVEGLTGRRPEGLILQHADPGRADIEPLATAVLGELRGRFLNPGWLKPLMGHGYAGARTMGQEFLENLWGWQVTRPDLIENWAWDEVKSVYFDDAHQLGLPGFLGQGTNAHVKAHMLSIFLVAAHKGFWKTDAATIRQLGGELARLSAKNGLPGSGHTAPNHPMWDWLKPQLDAADAQAIGVVLAKARGEAEPVVHAPAAAAAKPTLGPQAAANATLAEPPAPEAAAPPAAPPTARAYELERVAPPGTSPAPFGLLLLLPLLFLAGLWRGLTFTPTFPRRTI